jgi:hypothetical protein
MTESDARTFASQIIDDALIETRTWSTAEVRRVMNEAVAIVKEACARVADEAARLADEDDANHPVAVARIIARKIRALELCC